MPNPALQLDYLFVGPLIEARLADQVPGVRWQFIEHPEQIIEPAAGGTPSGFVYWYAEKVDESADGRAAGGASQLSTFSWAVVLMVRNASQVKPDARTAAAGPVLSQVHKALSGWTPEGALRPLRRANGPRPDFKPGGTSLFPQTFSVTLAL